MKHLKAGMGEALPGCPPAATVREFTNELGNRIRITIEGPTSTSENVLTPMEAAELRAALDKHGAKAGPPWCCEKGEAANAAMCPDCTEACAGYQEAMGRAGVTDPPMSDSPP